MSDTELKQHHAQCFQGLLYLTMIIETKHHRESFEEDYNFDGTGYKVFFAGPQGNIRDKIHHCIVLAIKATHWAESEGQ